MRRLAIRCLIFAVPSILILADVVLGQSRPSHQFDPDDTPPKNLAKLLEARRSNRLGNIDPSVFRDLLKKLPPGLDPKQFDEATIRKFLDDHPELKDPKKLEKLREMVQQQLGVPPDPEDPKVDWKDLQGALKQVEEIHKKPKIGPMKPADPKVDPVRPKEPPLAKQPPPPPPRPPDKQTQDFTRWLAKNFGDSPAMRDTAKDFANIMTKDGKGIGTDFLASVEKEWKGFIGSNGKAGDRNSSWHFDDLISGLKLPDLRGSSSNRSFRYSGGGGWSDRTQNFGSSSSGGSLGGFGSGAGNSMIVVGLLAAAGLLFWYFCLRRRAAPVVEENVKKRVWPVAPGEVKTREDVVKAFEYLSLEKCGEEAINWHHHQIADQMGTTDPHRQEAAARLADLYEKARYAPANEHFTETDIAEARARLQQLAGVSAA